MNENQPIDTYFCLEMAETILQNVSKCPSCCGCADLAKNYFIMSRLYKTDGKHEDATKQDK